MAFVLSQRLRYDFDRDSVVATWMDPLSGRKVRCVVSEGAIFDYEKDRDHTPDRCINLFVGHHKDLDRIAGRKFKAKGLNAFGELVIETADLEAYGAH